MAQLIPENLPHFSATAFAHKAELQALGAPSIIKSTARQLSDQMLRKLFEDYIRVEEDYQGHTALSLDVYVLSPSDLRRLIADIREEAERDCMHNYSFRQFSDHEAPQ